MKRRNNNKALLRLLALSLTMFVLLSFSGKALADSVIPDGAVFKGESVDKKGVKFPSTIRIISIDNSSGDFIGEIAWTSVNSVHKIVGRIAGNTVVFKETEYIKKGRAVLNCEYAFVYDGKTLQGRWVLPYSDYGTSQYTIQ